MVVYAGNASRAALAFLLNTLIARLLGPEAFSVYYFFIVVTMIAHSFFGEGLDAAVVRYYTYSAANDPARIRTVVGSALFLRLAIATPFLIAGLLGSDWLAVTVFDNVDYALPLKLGVIVGFETAMISFALALLQAREEFRLRGVLTPFYNLLRVAVVPVFIAAGIFTLPVILWSHVVLAVVSLIPIFWVVRTDLASMTVTRKQLAEIFHVSKWSSVVYFSYFVYCYMGVPALSYFQRAVDSGVYAAAVSFSMVIEYAIASITTVQLPAVSKMTTMAAFRAYIRSSAPRSATTAALLLPIVFFAPFIISFVYGDRYEDAAVVLRILTVGGLVSLVAAPLSTVFYGIDRADLLALTHVVSMFAWFGLAAILIPSYSIIGAAVATLLARLINAALIFFIVWRVFRSQERSGAGVS